jgi:hypothetical protein
MRLPPNYKVHLYKQADPAAMLHSGRDDMYVCMLCVVNHLAAPFLQKPAACTTPEMPS